MKKISLLLLSFLILGCSGTGVQLSFEDDKSNSIRAHYQNYLNNDMDGLKSLWSPELKVYLNSTESITLEELEVLLQAQHATFSPIKKFGWTIRHTRANSRNNVFLGSSGSFFPPLLNP